MPFKRKASWEGLRERSLLWILVRPQGAMRAQGGAEGGRTARIERGLPWGQEGQAHSHRLARSAVALKDRLCIAQECLEWRGCAKLVGYEREC